MKCNASSGAIYGLGFLGAALYYIQTSNGFSEIIIGFIKAIIWPAVFVYEGLKLLG